MKLLQWGNSKLDFPVFNIPASQEICGRTCSGCYSHKAYRIWPSILVAQQKRYEATLQPDFVSRIKKELKSFRRPFKYVRIHASAGEFYNNEYIKSWYRIVSTFPEITFYAYTKRLKELDFTEIGKLPNFVLINSFHFGRLNYGTREKAPPNAFICPHVKGSHVKCGFDCTHCMTKGQADVKSVYFIQH
jgi:hypothetical protein